jgi:ABC-type amino acid transport substrate-binding protein
MKTAKALGLTIPARGCYPGPGSSGTEPGAPLEESLMRFGLYRSIANPPRASTWSAPSTRSSRIRRGLGPGIAGALVLALAAVAHAESSLDAIRARGVLRVGVKADAPPFGSLDAAGKPVGFEIDLARFFARILFDDDKRIEFVPVTTATRFETLKAGRVDLVAATITATDERRKLAELSDPYFMSASLVLVARASKADELADLGGRRVAAVRGSVQERDAAEVQPRALPVAVESVAAGAQAVKSGQADAFVYDDVVLLRLAQLDSALRVTGRPIRPRPFAVAARKGDAELIRWVNGWLAKMRRDGSYSALWHRYFAPFESRLVGG